MSNNKPVLLVTVAKSYMRMGWSTVPHYATTVNGVQYTNSNKVELRNVIQRKNPDVRIVLEILPVR